MGVFSRFKDIVNANINSLLDKAEDPEKMIKLMMQEMEDTLIEMKSACAEKIAKQNKFERERKEKEDEINRWAARATLAMKRGREDLAREALTQKLRLQKEFDDFLQDGHLFAGIVENCKQESSQLEDKLQSVRQKYTMMKHRFSHVRAEQASRQNRTGAGSSEERDYAQLFSHMEEHMERMAGVQSGFTVDRNLEDEFSDLEEHAEVEAELEKLRQNAKK